MKQLILLLISILTQSLSMACRGLDSEDYVLLNKLPPSALEQAVVAKVQLIKLNSDNQSATVRVIDAIKDTKNDEVIKLVTTGSSCSWLSQNHRFGHAGGTNSEPAPTIFYIAGSWKKNDGMKIFNGAWRRDQRID